MSEDAKRKLEKVHKKLQEKTEIIRLSRLSLRSALGFGMPLRDRIFEKQGQLMENLKQRFNQKQQLPRERFQRGLPQQNIPHQPIQNIQHHFPRPQMPIRQAGGELLSAVSSRVRKEEKKEPERRNYEPPPPPKPREYREERQNFSSPEIVVSLDGYEYSAEQKKKKIPSSISVED